MSTQPESELTKKAREVIADLRAFGRMRLAQSQRAIDAARIEAPHLLDALTEAHERLGAEVRAAVLYAERIAMEVSCGE